MSFAATATVTAIAGAGLSFTGQRQAARSASRRADPGLQDQLAILDIKRKGLSELSQFGEDILRSFDPSTGLFKQGSAEQQLINRIRTVSRRNIDLAFEEAGQQALQLGAGAGLKDSARTRRFIRKLAIESAGQKGTLENQLQQQLINFRNQRIQQGLQASGAAGGTAAPIGPLSPQPLNQQQALGSALTSLGGAGLQFAAQQQAAQTIADSLRQGGVSGQTTAPAGVFGTVPAF